MKSTPAYQRGALRLLRLYPRAWRERYGDEAEAILEERPATPRTLFDLLLGMLDAYTHNDLFAERKFIMLQRLRNSQITIFCLSILSILSCFADQIVHNSLMGYNVLINYAMFQNSISVADACVLLGTLVGGAILSKAILSATAVKHNKGFSRLFAAWGLGVAALLIVFLLLFIHQKIAVPSIVMVLGIRPSYVYELGFCIVALLIAWVAIIGPLSLFLQMRKAEVPLQSLRITFLPTLIIILAMSIMTVGLLILAFEFTIQGPGFNGLKRGMFFNLDAICMLILTVLAYISFWKNLGARRVLALS